MEEIIKEKVAVMENVIDNVNRRISDIENICPTKAEKINNMDGRIIKNETNMDTMIGDVKLIFKKLDRLNWTIGVMTGIGIAINVIINLGGK